GNTTEHRFEVLKDVDGGGTDDASELAALTTGRASMTEPYRFGKTDYRAIAVSDRVRVYAVPMAAASVVTIDGHPLPAEGYVEVDVSEGGRTVQLSVQPAGGGTAKV